MPSSSLSLPPLSQGGHDVHTQALCLQHALGPCSNSPTPPPRAQTQSPSHTPVKRNTHVLHFCSLLSRVICSSSTLTMDPGALPLRSTVQSDDEGCSFMGGFE